MRFRSKEPAEQAADIFALGAIARKYDLTKPRLRTILHETDFTFDAGHRIAGYSFAPVVGVYTFIPAADEGSLAENYALYGYWLDSGWAIGLGSLKSFSQPR